MVVRVSGNSILQRRALFKGLLIDGRDPGHPGVGQIHPLQRRAPRKGLFIDDREAGLGQIHFQQQRAVRKSCFTDGRETVRKRDLSQAALGKGVVTDGREDGRKRTSLSDWHPEKRLTNGLALYTPFHCTLKVCLSMAVSLGRSTRQRALIKGGITYGRETVRKRDWTMTKTIKA